jgi:two-component system, cell cycle sensor histidine kinase and response regulator CckA
VSNQVEQFATKEPPKISATSHSPVGRILVVDDEPELKNILVKSLSAQGFDVTGCSNGQQALEALRQKEFDLLLTDLMMPEMDGIALLEAAGKIDPHLISIMMTGQGTIKTAVDAMKLGAFDYVLKPFRLQSVMPVLTRAINTRRLRMENLQLRETVAIYSLCQTIAFTLDVQTVLSRLADAALQQSDADEVSILLPTGDGKELYVAAVRGDQRERLLGERVPLQESISSWVARERTPLILNGEVHDDRFLALWPRPDIRSAVSIPMQVANKLVGIINLNVTSRVRPFTLGQMKALSILASTAAAALESASLHNQVLQAERNYRSLFENAVEGIFQSTPDRRFLTVNPALAHILGYDSPAAVVAGLTDIGKQLYVDPACHTQISQTLEEHGVVQGFEFEAYRKNGDKIWLSQNLRVRRDDKGIELCREGTIEDITDRKRAEAEIESQRLRLNNIVASVPGVVWEAWGEPDSANQRIDFVSDYVEEMLGYSVEEWTSTPNFWLSIVHPDDKESAAHEASEAFISGKGIRMEFRWLAKDGREIWIESNIAVVFDAQGEPIGTRGVNTDISERKRAEEALRRSENQLAEAQRVAHIGSWNWDLQKKEITWSDEHYRIFGVEPDEININYEEVVREFIHPQDQEWVRSSVMEAIKTGEAYSFDVRILRRDGEERLLQSSGSIETDEHGQPIRMFGTAQDVTERRRTEQKLKQSEERYRDLVENAHDLIYEHDLEGNLVSTNTAVGQFTGYSIEESVHLNLNQILAPEHLGIAQEMIRRKLLGEKATAFELEIIGRNGDRVPIEVNSSLVFRDGVAVGVRGIARDITERRLSEKALRDSEERYRLLFDSNPQPMWVYDLGTLAFLAVNQAAVKSYGYSREEFLSMTIQDIRPSEDLPALYGAVKSSAEGIETAGRWQHLKKDGTLIKVEITSHLLVFDGRQAELMLANDVTEQNRLEHALLATEQQLRQSQKLEAIGQLAGGVAHDFNNLLTVIGGYSSILLNKLDPESPLRLSVEEIKKASDRAAGLTRQLLAFSRKQILQPKILDLNVVVSDLEKMVRRIIGEDIDLLAITDPQLGQVKADPGQLEQVLLNLIVNARDAMPGGGKLTIETANAILSPDYALSHGTPDGPYVMLAVSDTGCGMDAELQKHVFEPFFTTKVPGKGTGLGLATVYGIVKQSEGHIWLYSEVDKGTCFKIYLPRLDEVAPNQITTGSLKLIPKGTETLLLVEDEDQVRQIVKAILEQQGYDVLEAANGEEALKLAKVHGARLHLLMTDLVMPLMSGRELAEQLSTTLPKLKVLYMSGYTDDAIVRHGLLDASLSFIQKPFDAATVARKVREVLDSPVL